MSDYIDILLTALEDELFPSLGKETSSPSSRRTTP